MCFNVFFFFKQKTAYEMRISDWSSDVCSSDLRAEQMPHAVAFEEQREVERAGRHGLEIIGAVEEGGAVEIGRADLAQRFEEIIGEIGRASCRERGCQYLSISVVAVSLKQNELPL